MQVTRTTFLPLLAPAQSDRIDPGAVRDEYCADLSVIYTYGPQFGRRLVTHGELDQMEMPAKALRRAALEHLEVLAGRAEFHGQPPVLMLSFEGLESSLLLATDFWSRLQGAVPGELVVGVPARDVVVVTGSMSRLGLEKARRCVDRVFMAGDDFPLTPRLLVRRGTMWEPFDGPARRPAHPMNGMRRPHGPGQQPRQYQEHPSWPSERLAPVSPMRPGAGGPYRPGAVPVRLRPAQPLAPAAQMSPAPASTTGSLPAAGLGSVSPAGRPAPVSPGHGGPAGPISGGVGPVSGGVGPVSGGASAMPSSPARGGASPALPRQHRAQAARPADVAPYSAVPYSAVPYSGVPYSAVPHSAMPMSAVPYSAVPYSGVPYSAIPYSGPPVSRARLRPAPASAYDPLTKPAYGDHFTPADPRPSYAPGYEPASAYQPISPAPSSGGAYRSDAAYGTHQAPPTPSYPSSWDRSNSHPEWRSSPRARFSR